MDELLTRVPHSIFFFFFPELGNSGEERADFTNAQEKDSRETEGLVWYMFICNALTSIRLMAGK